MRRISLFTIQFILFICTFSVTAQAPIAEADWARDYVAALDLVKVGPVAACQEFQRLAGQNAAPIAALAHARDLQYCSGAGLSGALAELALMAQDSTLNWLRPLVGEILVKLAIESNDARALADYATLQVPNLSSQREKEQLLVQAIAAARGLGLSARVQELESALFAISPRLNLNPPASEWMKVADDFKTNEQWDDAKVYYQRLIATGSLSPAAELHARDGIRQIEKFRFRKNLGDLATFLNASREVADFASRQLKNGGVFDDRRPLVEAWVQYARDEWSYGDEAKAQATLTIVIGSGYVEEIFKAYAYLFRSRIFAGDGAWTDAAAAGAEGTRILTSLIGTSDQWGSWQWGLWDDGFWAEAFADRKAGNLQASIAALQWALYYSKNASQKIKFKFWLAQNEKTLGMASAAALDWNAVVGMDPNGYYGFVARGELNAPISTLPDLDMSDVAQPASLSDHDFAILHWLTRAGERTLAQTYSRQVMSSKSYAVDELRLRAFTGDYAFLWTIFYAQIPADQRDTFLANNARLFYPKPFFDLVDKATKTVTGVDNEYVYAIMRQESGFNPWALSPVNAYGLLQLMPATARRIAPVAGVTFTDDYELFLPRINIPLGVTFMGELVGAVNGSFILRTIGYNAELVKGLEWKQKFYQGDIYEFVEQIPYDETRTYVRLVMRNYLMNKRLNAAVPFFFPLDILNL